MNTKNWDKAPVKVEKIADLTLNWWLYPRKELDQQVVETYAKAIESGSVFPSVKVGILNEKKIVVDGFHRIHSRILLNIDYVECSILIFQSEAELFAEAVRLNSDHGKSFTEAEIKASIKQLQKYKFDIKDIVALTHVPASEIYREAAAPITVLTGPGGRKIHCDIQKVDCNGQPTTHEILQFKNALLLIRDVAQKHCIPTDDAYFRDLVTQCHQALGRVRFNTEGTV